MFFFIFFILLLLSVWEECRSFPHSRIYNTDDFQLQSTESNTTATSMRKQVSKKKFFFIFIKHTHMHSKPHWQLHCVRHIPSRLKHVKRKNAFTPSPSMTDITHARILKLSADTLTHSDHHITPTHLRNTFFTRTVVRHLLMNTPDKTQQPLMLHA